MYLFNTEHLACQRDIEDTLDSSITILALKCISCKINGPGKCDPDGCPEKTVYVESINKCAGKMAFNLRHYGSNQ